MLCVNYVWMLNYAQAYTMYGNKRKFFKFSTHSLQHMQNDCERTFKIFSSLKNLQSHRGTRRSDSA